MKELMSIEKFHKLLQADNKSDDSLLAALRQLTKVSSHKDLSSLRKPDAVGWWWEW